MRFKLHLDGEVREVAAGPAGQVKVDGGDAATKVTAPAADRRVVEVNGKSYDFRVVDSQVESGEFLLELAGELIVVKAGDVVRETAPAKRAAAVSAAPADGRGTAPASESRAAAAAEEVTNGVWAPMPGKIAKVLVKAGQDVKEGDPVIVLEAMKMENELRSPSAGTVGSVLVAEGDQAEAGQLLIAFV
jgi:glutaconyl-CoA/methylmalonyl-CoA decarboxylase subunit gamma